MLSQSVDLMMCQLEIHIWSIVFTQNHVKLIVTFLISLVHWSQEACWEQGSDKVTVRKQFLLYAMKLLT